MSPLNILTELGPLSGTVIVVFLFIRAINTNMKEERLHREKLAGECHEVQKRATEATVRAVGMMERTEVVLNKVNTTLIRINGRKP